MSADELNKRLNSLNQAKTNSRVRNLYTLLLNDFIWLQAYQNIHSNSGATTIGTDKEDTLSNFNISRIQKIINKLKEGTYSPNPSKRIYIPKANGKLRPLGIPGGTDKLVQESCRIILESIYESKFSDLSHGFRQGRSCHTALKEIYTWTGTKWWIEFDIKGCFDNINHHVLRKILEERIDSKSFLNLIEKFLKAGYLDNWKFNNTYSGTPQGGIISPILANIYLDKLDKFIENMCESINNIKVNPSRRNKEYNDLTNKLRHAKETLPKMEAILAEINEFGDKFMPKGFIDPEDMKIYYKAFELRRNLKGDSSLNQKIKNMMTSFCDKYNLDVVMVAKSTRYMEITNKIKECENIIETLPNIIRNTKSRSNEGLNRLHYVRYADDFVLGYIGSKEEVTKIYTDIEEYIKNTLELEISKEKSGIRDKTKGIRFLGYDIAMPEYTEEHVTNINNITKRRNIVKPVFKVPVQKAIDFVNEHQYGDYVGNTSTHVNKLIHFDNIEIVKQYNAELRGLANYYRFALNYKSIIGKIQWIWQYSLFKTIGAKHRLTVAKLFKEKVIHTRILDNYGKQFYLIENEKIFPIYSIKDTDSENIFKINTTSSCVDNSNTNRINIRSSALLKLQKNECEVCGISGSEVTIYLHHPNRIRNIDPQTKYMDKIKQIRSRKVIALCYNCHIQHHVGSWHK